MGKTKKTVVKTKKEQCEERTITLFIFCKEVKTDKETFTAYKTPFGGISVDVKFRKETKCSIPKGDGYYSFNTKDINISCNGDYPVIWVH